MSQSAMTSNSPYTHISESLSAARNTDKQSHKHADRKIVFTNGCFDIVHIGHLATLRGARALGDFLVVGLNSDASIKRLKGPERPIVPQNERKELLESLRFVDAVFVFDEDTPYELIKAVKPDILVKGGDWEITQIIGHDLVASWGGKTYSIPYIANHSTSLLLDRIKSL